VFTGEYRHTVDDKGRLAIPARFRAQLADGAVLSRWIDGCLAIHTKAGWDLLSERVAAVPVTDPAGRLFQRQIFAGAFEAEVDRQGRILIPAYLREEAGLESEAVVAGIRDVPLLTGGTCVILDDETVRDPQAFADAIAGLGI